MGDGTVTAWVVVTKMLLRTQKYAAPTLGRNVLSACATASYKHGSHSIKMIQKNYARQYLHDYTAKPVIGKPSTARKG